MSTRIVAVLYLILGWCAAVYGLEFAAPFQNHVVIQRGTPIEVWGTGEPGVNVRVSLADEETVVKADDEGRWRAVLPEQVAGGPFQLKASSEAQEIQRDDVLIGDVWVCSGQSNMEWTVERSGNAEEEIATADYPAIRFIDVAPTKKDEPSELVKGNWTVCSPATVGKCSAVAYYFAREQWRKHGVPVGLIVAPVGGTPIEQWISRQAFLYDPKLSHVVKDHDFRVSHPEEAHKQFAKRHEAWRRDHFKVDQMMADQSKDWMKMDLDESDWLAIEQPDYVEKVGHRLDGVFWLRRTIVVPESWRGKDLILRFGRVDDCDVTYVNGAEVGRTTFAETMTPWMDSREYQIPAKLVDGGEAVIAVRVFDYSGLGGFSRRDKLTLQPADKFEEDLSLAGTWKFRVEAEVDGTRIPPAPTPPAETSLFYNGMIAPFVGYPLKGVLWYQGEGNANNPFPYRDLFQLLIKDWRQQWHRPELPFLFVQLANYEPRGPRPYDPNDAGLWTFLRESQAAALQLPATGMVTAIDIGESDNIHPANKQEVGRRLCRVADRVAHGEAVASAGPRLSHFEVEKGSIRLEFANVEGGLVARGSALKGFAIAGKDRTFHWADARIEEACVIVSSPQVPQPVSVRYAWSDNPTEANLKNAEGLPAEPFRTDDWSPF